MYQSFEEAAAPAASGERVKALQRELRSRRLKGFLVPHSDEHQDEFLSPSAERLAWLTGFTGSAGVAIVLDKAAALFVDGRYILQARAQVDPTLFEVLADARRQGVDLAHGKARQGRGGRRTVPLPCPARWRRRQIR